MRTRESAEGRGGAAERGREREPAAPDVDDYEGEYDDEDEFEDEFEDEDEDQDEEYEELSPAEAARSAARHIAGLTGKELCGVVSLERSDDGWLVGVEVVEDRRIPSSNDVLGLYAIEVDQDGELVSYRRSRRYARGRGDRSEVI